MRAACLTSSGRLFAFQGPPSRPRRRARPRHRLGGLSSRTRRSTRTSRFMVPMHGCKAEGASHETWIGTSSPRPSPPLGAEERVPGGRERRRFGSMSQCMRKSERGLSKNRPGHRIVAWLGKAALKTHALQTLRDCRASPKRAKRLECVRFIGAFRRARDGRGSCSQRMRASGRRLSMNRAVRAPGLQDVGRIP